MKHTMDQQHKQDILMEARNQRREERLHKHLAIKSKLGYRVKTFIRALTGRNRGK